MPFGKREFAFLGVLLLAAFIVRFLFFWHQGYAQIDTHDFMVWFQTAAEHGPRIFYSQTWCDYPPLNIYLFWIFGSLAEGLGVFGTEAFTYVMKLPSNLFDLATAFVIFAFIRKRLNFKSAFFAAALYAFNPAVIFNTAVWGQFDAIYTFFLIFSLYLVLESKPKLAIAVFMLGVLTKPQSIALAPLFFFVLWRDADLKQFVSTVLAAVVTVFAVILPFEWSNPVTFLTNIYFGAYSTYAYTTINAFNLWGFGGMWVPDTQATFLLGWAMFGAVAVFSLYFVQKRLHVSREMAVWFAAFVLFFAFFMLPTRIHERYLFPALAVLALMFPLLKKTRPLYVALTATVFVNQAYVLSFLVTNDFIGAGDPVVLIVSLINSASFLYVLALMWSELKGKHWLTPTKTRLQEPKEPAGGEKDEVKQT
ncbi:MAG: glycosyltransferase family 39 protein [Candidatus Bathyarchaeota archaeon]|nr:glycosyltransferase family 39 protein [Candidatus Bathyarchaeota archaeon]